MKKLWLITTLLFFNTAFNQPLLVPLNLEKTENILTTQDSLNLLLEYTLKSYEGFRNKAYWDYKQYTIGWGTRSKKGEYLSIEQADERFEQFLSQCTEKIVQAYPHLKEGQLVSTIMLAYNVRAITIISSNQTNKALVSGKKPPFKLWNKAGGKVLPALVKRRKYESLIWDDWRKVYNNQFLNYKNHVDGIYQSQANTIAARQSCKY